MSGKSWKGRTRRDLIIEVWEDLDCESVGTRELEQIQQALQDTLGEGAQESPASIARTVADEGAVLRHPEVFECDAKWRERLIAGIVPLDSLSFANLAEAAAAIRKIESWRRELAGKDTQSGLRRLQEHVLKTKQDLQLVARSRVVDGKRRSEAGEIVEWLTIWLLDPVIFEDWLSLRQRSTEFLRRFRE